MPEDTHEIRVAPENFLRVFDDLDWERFATSWSLLPQTGNLGFLEHSRNARLGRRAAARNRLAAASRPHVRQARVWRGRPGGVEPDGRRGH
jgi:hypothetical protein